MTVAENGGFFLAVAVSEYEDEGWDQPLSGALQSATKLEQILKEEGYSTELVPSPSYGVLAKIFAEREAAAASGSSNPAVLVWTGHAAVHDEALSLAVHDTPSGPGMGPLTYRAGDLASFLANLGSTDWVIIIDSCSAGAGDAEIFVNNLNRLERTSKSGRQPAFGCIVSCKSYEDAVDGAFLAELVELLRRGPVDVEPGPHDSMWSPNQEAVPIASVLQAIERKRRTGSYPRGTLVGASDITFSNPRFDPAVGPGLVDDGARMARGEEPLQVDLIETPAASFLLDRLGTGKPGLLAIIGGPGTGKSSCLSYVETRSRADLLLLQARSGIESLASTVATAAPATTIALDALDEASTSEHGGIAALATGWARTRQVIVATRTASARNASGRTAAIELLAGAELVIDLSEARWQGDAIEKYVRDRLGGETDEE